MDVKDLHLRRAEFNTQLLPQLVGRVFHVTALSSLRFILEDGAIRPNDGRFESPFGSTNAYFKHRGCVSVFDYRVATDDQIETSLGKCSVLRIIRPALPIACLFLSETVQARLIPYTKDMLTRGKIVPHVEAGHEGPIPISEIAAVLRVTIERDKWPAYEEMIQRTRARKTP